MFGMLRGRAAGNTRCPDLGAFYYQRDWLSRGPDKLADHRPWFLGGFLIWRRWDSRSARRLFAFATSHCLSASFAPFFVQIGLGGDSPPDRTTARPPLNTAARGPIRTGASGWWASLLYISFLCLVRWRQHLRGAGLRSCGAALWRLLRLHLGRIAGYVLLFSSGRNRASVESSTERWAAFLTGL